MLALNNVFKHRIKLFEILSIGMNEEDTSLNDKCYEETWVNGWHQTCMIIQSDFAHVKLPHVLFL